ncbi:MAG: hypothetical protein NXI04_22450 [Planctomycetaceae bacterium]|nr:hypothetical protein [Planctomycetaceae bacterium]
MTALALSLVCTHAASTATAQDLAVLAQKVGVRVLAEATSDKDVMAWSRQRLPYPQMSPGARDRASRILANTSQYRRMPSLQYPVDPNMYQYLINHPDVAVSTWRAMGISKLQMSQKSRFEYEASAADGSDGIADVLWRDANQCLFIVEGRYNSPVLPSSINASALVWLRYRFVRNTKGEILVNQQVETFVHFHSAAIETIARLASRITNSILDRNVFEVSLYARMMSQAGQKDPQWISEVAARLDGVPANRRTELVRVSRGLRPYGVNTALRQPPSETAAVLHMSQQFRNFASSMQHVKQHVPIVPVVVTPQAVMDQIATAASELNAEDRAVSSTTPAADGLRATAVSQFRVTQDSTATTEVATPLLAAADDRTSTQSATSQQEIAEPLVPPAEPMHQPRAEVSGLIALPPVEPTERIGPADPRPRQDADNSQPAPAVAVETLADPEPAPIDPVPVPPALP